MDGRYFLSGSYDHTIKLWKLDTGECLCTLEGYSGQVNSVALSPDCGFALTGGYDKDGHSLRLWRLDWDLEDTEPGEWDEKATGYLKNFLAAHKQRRFSLFSKSKWSEEEFQGLLYTLGCAGFGWLRPEVVRRKLNKMA
jgi:WD40 repeat protein